jgi:hypothetical protein
MFGIWECKVNENHQQYSQKPHAVRAVTTVDVEGIPDYGEIRFWCTANMHDVRSLTVSIGYAVKIQIFQYSEYRASENRC